MKKGGGSKWSIRRRELCVNFNLLKALPRGIFADRSYVVRYSHSNLYIKPQTKFKLSNNINLLYITRYNLFFSLFAFLFFLHKVVLFWFILCWNYQPLANISSWPSIVWQSISKQTVGSECISLSPKRDRRKNWSSHTHTNTHTRACTHTLTHTEFWLLSLFFEFQHNHVVHWIVQIDVVSWLASLYR